MKCSWFFAVGCGLLAGCVATGAVYEDVRSEITELQHGVARLVFYRTDDSLLYSARSARVLVDGQKAGGCALGGFFYRDVSPGAHRLIADMWDAPGHCEVLLSAEAGSTYYFQVDPRPESFWAFAGPATVSDLLGQNIVFSVAAGVGGITAESYGKECGGAFRLYPVDPQTARQRLSRLRLSE